MSISLVCANGHKLKAKAELAGRSLKCPKCGAVVTVPSPDPAPSDDPFSDLASFEQASSPDPLASLGNIDLLGADPLASAPSASIPSSYMAMPTRPASSQKKAAAEEKKTTDRGQTLHLLQFAGMGAGGGASLAVVVLLLVWLFRSPAPADASKESATNSPSAPDGSSPPTTTVEPSVVGEAIKLVMPTSGLKFSPEVATKLKKIGLALDNFHDTYRQFPVVADKGYVNTDGMPKLSWRVHLLPFVDQKPLYEKFKLDEPWDSPNNKPLLDLMPDVFRSHPDDKSITRMQMFAGKDTFYEGLSQSETKSRSKTKKPALQNVPDGPSHTILVVHTGSDQAMEWTRPEHLDFDPANPLAALGNLDGWDIQCVMAGGDVVRLPPDIKPNDFAALVTARGSEIIDIGNLKREELPSVSGVLSTMVRAVVRPGRVTGGGGGLDALTVRAKLQTLSIGLAARYSALKSFTEVEADSAESTGTRLSWRVHLLPFLGQEELHRRFHLNEPWDSPHNKTLLDTMPDLYRLGNEKSTTCFQVFSGPDLIFGPGRKIGFQQIHQGDGLENTILIVVTGFDRAVPWTRPDQLALDRTNPVAALGKLPHGTIECAVANGTLATLPATIPPDKFVALVTPAGKEVVDIKSLLIAAAAGGAPASAGASTPVTEQALIPVVTEQQKRANQTKLKSIGNALLEYRDMTRGMFPVAGQNKKHFDSQGHPLLSWRVHLLRNLEQEQLFQKFKLDEPWDSPTNKPLLEQMPDVYRSATDAAGSTTTRFLMPVHKDAICTGQAGLRFQDLQDSSASMISVTLADPSKAVPWTKPDDLPVADINSPIASFGRIPGTGMPILLVDGSAVLLKPTVTDQILRALLTRSGNERLSEAEWDSAISR